MNWAVNSPKKSLIRLAFPTVVSAYLEVWQYFLSLSCVTISESWTNLDSADKYTYWRVGGGWGGSRKKKKRENQQQKTYPKNIYWVNQIS